MNPDRDVADLKNIIARDGPFQCHLSPDDVDELEEDGFRVVVDDVEADSNGQKPATVTLVLS